jgi:UDP-glucose 4-epimerase
MKTLIIGGAGFIGRHVTRLLSQTGRNVYVADLRPEYELPLPKGVSYHCIARAADYGLTLPELRGDFDEIIDLAYTSVPKVSYENPAKDISENLPRFVRLLHFAAERCKGKFVFLSSGGTVYGQAKFLPITENHPLEPLSPYGIIKLATEKYAAMYGLQLGIHIICLRPGNVYGEGQLPFRGQGFVATAIGSVLEDKPIEVFGPTGTVRDYIHVEDTARAVFAVLEKGVTGTTYNVGTTRGLDNANVLDILKIALPAAYSMPPIKYLPERVFDVRENILDCSRLSADTDWEAEIPFEEGLKRSFSWLEQNQLKKENGAE